MLVMLPVPMTNAPKNGFCCGTYEVTAHIGPRIRLPADIVRTFREHNVQELWIYPDPTGRRLILCPDSSRDSYIKTALKNLPQSWTKEEGIRRFICTDTSVVLRKHGRISIGQWYPTEFGVMAGKPVVVVGTGLWYELWRAEDWLPPKNRRPRTEL